MKKILTLGFLIRKKKKKNKKEKKKTIPIFMRGKRYLSSTPIINANTQNDQTFRSIYGYFMLREALGILFNPEGLDKVWTGILP